MSFLQDWGAVAIVAAAPIFVLGVAVWALTQNRRGHWRRLVQAYGYGGEVPPQGRSRFNDAWIGRAYYRGLVTLAADARGIYLSRPFAKPLLLPWNEMSVREGRVLFDTTRILELHAVPGLPVTLRASVFEKLTAQARELRY